MKIYSAIQIGEYHENNCEDHLYVGEYGKNKTLCAVMDGCTTALESHFASVLIGKILKKICLEKGYKEFIEPSNESLSLDENLKLILKNLLNELKIVKNQLMLDNKELLTTLIIILYDKKEEHGIVLIIGDGLVNINGVITEYEQDNKPDYLGFHLSEDFEKFYNSQKQKIEFNDLADISISTDGIFTFERVMSKERNDEINVIDFLTTDDTYCEKEEMLNLKLKILQNEFGVKPTDDFSMIRIIK
ncbi:serine/threonine protein phosphatase PrpC [Flavobacterium nitrogenifigens]|uniref:Serine/threonine protein phosphatase PrpC n=2 Tax=Flavobacterium TaxID=237 RepID=A0A7W7N4Y0_9FLAO|nr:MULTISPECIES: protein phosphatase 2C domain-containing protein [Flavobacterium]MBB4799968.1 serine/threonine protein phosphatase PrpC [Flavobacterium nitrogenifigens]MBB6386282.1 serine/threonine protein phosphatase PrpC [Flavobacterium notoginsengisoli]